MEGFENGGDMSGFRSLNNGTSKRVLNLLEPVKLTVWKVWKVKKEARLSARALAEVKVGRGEEELRCNSLFIVCQRRRGFSADEETRLE